MNFFKYIFLAIPLGLLIFIFSGCKPFVKLNYFFDEPNNETIQQLLLSESIWIVEGANLIPVNIKTLSNEWKTQLNNSLINYTIEFEYSYNLVNNV